MTILKSVCMYCKRAMGEKDGGGVSGTSHGICPACWKKTFPDSEYPIKATVTYRGWPGHYILSHRCVFHLNTLIELAGIRVIVSTVGNLRTKDNKQDEVGSGCYYETMAFPALLEDGYWDADTDTDKLVSISGRSRVNHMTRTSDTEAQEMHEAAVADITSRIRKGEISNGTPQD